MTRIVQAVRAISGDIPITAMTPSPYDSRITLPRNTTTMPDRRHLVGQRPLVFLSWTSKIMSLLVLPVVLLILMGCIGRGKPMSLSEVNLQESSLP